MKKFNTAGPSIPGDHYMIDPLARIDSDEIEALIADKRYFVLHAPRQTGKTTSLLALMEYLNAQGKYRALYCNVEGAQAARGNIALGVATICNTIGRSAALYLKDDSLNHWIRETGEHIAAPDRITHLLELWSAANPKPAILLLDEVDSLVGDTLISLLRQIRAGYAQRPTAFPQTIILCGIRDVRDYRIHTAHNEIITGGSAFNIKATSLRMENLTQMETTALWRQHEMATGQSIDPAIYSELWADTWGQPWLVNALGYEVTWRDRELREHNRPITLERYKAARERLIQSRATHLDQLTDKLRELRVKNVIEAVLSGESDTLEARQNLNPDDQQYVEDLGLITTRPGIRISNRIYQEIIPREMTWLTQTRIPNQESAWYITAENCLNMPKLLTAFQQFFREHSEIWLDGFAYREAGPQLLMQAFLQRIVNGGGRINREYGLGRRRTDLFLEWPIDKIQGYLGPVQRVIIELKLLKQAPETTLKLGLEQTADYADRCGADEAYLILFERRLGKTWEERVWQRQEYVGERTIGVWGM